MMSSYSKFGSSIQYKMLNTPQTLRMRWDGCNQIQYALFATTTVWFASAELWVPRDWTCALPTTSTCNSAIYDSAIPKLLFCCHSVHSCDMGWWNMTQNNGNDTVYKNLNCITLTLWPRRCAVRYMQDGRSLSTYTGTTYRLTGYVCVRGPRYKEGPASEGVLDLLYFQGYSQLFSRD